MDIPTIPGAVYSVVAPNACTITDKATGRVLETTAPNKQKDFRAFGSLTTLSDPNAIYVAASTFSAAPTIGSGGGVTIQFDTRPTSGSTNAVTSGGLYDTLFSSSLKLARSSTAGAYAVAIGDGATSDTGGIAIGKGVSSKGGDAVVVGAYSSTTKRNTSAFGKRMILKDTGCLLIGVWNEADSIATQLYLINSGSPMANTYENGEACLGYIVKDVSGNIQACGTRKLSELLTNNTAFAPAALDLDAPAPTPFLPTGIMDPIELPENLTE